MQRHRRFFYLIAWLPGIILFLWPLPTAAGQEYRINPVEPSWAAPSRPETDRPVPEADVSAGIYYLLHERKVRLSAGRPEQYTHFAYQVVNTSGLEEAGEISITFDPSYQYVTVHTVRLLRAGRVIDVSRRAKMNLLQRETNLEQRIYDGSKTLSVILPDVREKDVVEFSYTLTGSNPVFGPRFTDDWYLRLGVGIGRSLYRVYVPAGQALFWKCQGGETPPIRSSVPGGEIYLWEQTNVQPVVLEDNFPSWYIAYPFVQITQYQSWREVADWARSLYDAALVGQRKVAPLARSLTKGKTTRTDKLTALIDFVQNSIRYLGIEFGPHSHKPTPPDTVITRRFGDCKDKSLLLTALCRAAGFEAWPVLVNTSLAARVSEYLPCPTAFNHVIVAIREDDRDYWIDPTVTHQGRTFFSITEAAFERGLVVRPGTDDLTSHPVSAAAEPMITSLERYDVSSGFTSPGTLAVSTVFHGQTADERRRYFEQTSRQQLQDGYKRFYESHLEQVDVTAPLSIEDNRAANLITVNESYDLGRPWVKDTDEGYYYFNLYPYDLDFYLKKPSAGRRSPFALIHPAFMQLDQEIRLPSRSWDLSPSRFEVKNDYFVFTITSEYKNGIYRAHYSYHSLRDNVPPEAVTAYNEDIDRLKKELDSMLYWSYTAKNRDRGAASHGVTGDRSAAAGSWGGLLIFAGTIFALMALIFIVRHSRGRNKRARPFLTCFICGRNSRQYPALAFVQCTKCEPHRHYCADHVVDHPHQFS